MEISIWKHFPFLGRVPFNISSVADALTRSSMGFYLSKIAFTLFFQFCILFLLGEKNHSWWTLPQCIQTPTYCLLTCMVSSLMFVVSHSDSFIWGMCAQAWVCICLRHVHICVIECVYVHVWCFLLKIWLLLDCVSVMVLSSVSVCHHEALVMFSIHTTC